MIGYRTAGYKGYALQYSPFFDNKIAVATAANYGLVGNGKLFILSIEPNGTIANQISWETQDGLFDVAWSEAHENHVVAASGDGSIKLFDLTVGQFPVQNWHEHSREVFSTNWNLVNKSNFVSSSWDGTIKVWDANSSQSLLTLSPKVDYTTRAAPTGAAPPVSHQSNHQNTTADCVYNALWAPHSPSTIISCNGLSHVQIWDIRAPQPLQMDYIAHGGLEVLTCDWNKYRPNIIASGSTDKSIRIWDLRMINNINQPSSTSSFHTRGPTPLNELFGHDFAVRKVQWSPHNSQELLSTGYDFTARVWMDLSNDQARFLNTPPGSLKGVMNQHKEFVIGCDYSLWGEPGWAATTGWDEMVYVWDTKRL